jgi:hypothetical protein
MELTPDEIVAAFAEVICAYAEQHGIACAVSARLERSTKLYAFSNTSIPNTEFLFAQALAQVTTHAPSSTVPRTPDGAH